MNSIALVLAAAALSQVQPPTFSAAVESVYVDASVYDKKGPITGLTSADFELHDNGVRQKVEIVALESLSLTTLLVLDTSGSVDGPKLEQLKRAGQALLHRVRAGDETALVTFGHEIRVDVPRTTNAPLVGRALDALRAGGSTAVYDALYAATMLAPERGRSLIVLFTDGEDNLSALDLADVLRVLERSNVMVHAVGVRRSVGSGGGVRRVYLSLGGHAAYSVDAKIADETPGSEPVRTLQRLAETTGGRFWTASDPHALAGAFTAIADAMRTRYVLRYDPEGVKREGRHTLAVKLKRRGGTVHCRKAYYVNSATP